MVRGLERRPICSRTTRTSCSGRASGPWLGVCVCSSPDTPGPSTGDASVSGTLFQNRYKSVVVEEESYFLELVRYLHLNPLRAKVVPTLRALDRYPWTGHSALLGYRPCPWQATGAVLQEFAPALVQARKAYRTFVADGIPLGCRVEFQGGGLVRSLGGWRAVAVLRRGAGGLPRGRADSRQCRVRGEGTWDASDNRSVARASAPSRSPCHRGVCSHRLSPNGRATG